MNKVAAIISITFVLALSANADDELMIARSALRDGLWDIARLHAANVDSDEARLVELESYVGEDRWDDVAKHLETMKELKGPGFDYYRMVVSGNNESAVRLLVAGGSAAGLVQARLYEADRLAKNGDTNSADVLWREVIANTNAGERAFAAACINTGDVNLMRRAYETVTSMKIRRMVGLRLGRALIEDASTQVEGEKLIRSIVSDSPDADGAKDAFIALADFHLESGRWRQSLDAFREASEIWPDVAKQGFVNEGIAISLWRLGKREEAFQAFVRAESLATDSEAKARAIAGQGDVLADLGRIDESVAIYRKTIGAFGDTVIAKRLKNMVAVRELENEGREHYRKFRFADASCAFAKVAAADPQRAARMDLYKVFCLYGQGLDVEAADLAGKLAGHCEDAFVRLEAMLWLAKLRFNRREWKKAADGFLSYAESSSDVERASDAMAWAARAELMNSDYAEAIRVSSKLLEKYPDSAVKARVLLVQGEALVEQSRFEEAILVMDRAMMCEHISRADRTRAMLIKADSLYALGADNRSRYGAALEVYNSLRISGWLTDSGEIVVAFKVARTLEKLRRQDEAVDFYYSKVVLAYRSGRERKVHYDEDAMAAFSRAAFRLADEYESRGKERQAVDILELVAESDVPAASEAGKRIKQISSKGRFL